VLRAAAIALLPFMIACSRSSEQPSDAATDAPSAVAPPASTSTAPPSRALAPPGEAKRAIVQDPSKEPDLAAHRDRLRDHFGDLAKGPFVVQRAALAWGRSGVLVAHGDESEPLILVTEGDRVVYAKERPGAGISPPPRAMTIVAHPAGGIAYVAFVPTINVVAMRIWADDGNPFADMQLFTMDACDALSAAYSPGAGWLVVAAKKSESRAQWIRDDGSLAWGHDGKTIAAPWRAAAPATIVFDTPKTAMVIAHASGGANRDHVLVFRYDAAGTMLWNAAADLGAVPRVEGTQQRIAARAESNGALRVELAGAGPGGTTQTMEIDASGKARLIR
jgi:hypothetical protein